MRKVAWPSHVSLMPLRFIQLLASSTSHSALSQGGPIIDTTCVRVVLNAER
jgi:hypothetical protein